MNRTLVLLDCDGPLANFSQGFLDLIEEETGHRFNESVNTEWEFCEAPFFIELAKELGRDVKELDAAVWKRANRIGFCSSLKLVEGAREAVEFLRDLDVDVEVLTSPLYTNPTWMPERCEWLQRHLGFKKHQIHLVAKKERVPGDYLIDDKPSHVVAWTDASAEACMEGVGLLWGAPYNVEFDSEQLPYGAQRVTSWAEACGIVRDGELVRRSPPRGL